MTGLVREYGGSVLIQGFLRSKAMIVPAVGMPALVVVLRLVQPDTEGTPFFVFTAIIIASIGETLGSVLLSTGFTNDRQQHVCDLFLIRPVSRTGLLLIAGHVFCKKTL